MTSAQVVQALRTLHIYLSLATFGVILFFAATGLILGLEHWWDWETQQTSERTLTLPSNIELTTQGPGLTQLRNALGFKGHLDSSDSQAEGQQTLVFTRPGWRGEATITLADRIVQIREEDHGVMGYLSDLHRSKSTSTAWRYLVPATAIALLLLTLTGIILWWKLLGRRKWGIVWMFVGLLIATAAALSPLL